MSDPRVTDMGFRDYLTNALMKLGDAEAAYNALIDGDDDARDEVTNLLADAAIAISLGSTKALNDAVALSRAARGDLTPDQMDDADMWAAITADVEAGLADMTDDAPGDPEEEARAARAIAGRGDLLTGPDQHEDWGEWLKDWTKTEEDDK